jgi:subtilisin family serine protease
MREYNVALKQGVDYDGFWNDMESDTDGGKLYIPNRAVQYTNERPASLRQCWYLLTDEEAETLRNDDRVYCVEIPPEHRDDIIMAPMATQIGDFTKVTTSAGSYLNWGLIRASNPTNVYGTGTTTVLNYDYTLDGTGVDVVIQDSGIQPDHPEFQDGSGVSRVQQIDWAVASGLAFTQNANHYRDYDGHGTHVAGIAAGKTYGWAKGSRIYSVKLNGLEGSGDSGTGISVTYAFDCIKNWHTAKAGSRPTVVNMSWGYLTFYNTVSSVTYRGTNYTDANTTGNATYRQSTYGIRNISGAVYGYNYICNTRIDSVDVDVQELLDAGVVVCVAAGNRSFKIDKIGGTDYNNTISTDTGTKYIHRGSSPHDDDALTVGNVDRVSYSSTLDQKATSSETGPGVDIWAPGTNIMSSCSTTTRFSAQNYYNNSSYRQVNISGTSMASPQVAGVCALILQQNPSWTPSQVKTSLLTKGTATIYTTGSDTRSLQGGSQIMLYADYDLVGITTTTTSTSTSTTTTSTSTTTTTTAAPVPTTTSTSTSTTSTSTSTSTTTLGPTTTTTTRAPVVCAEYMISTSKGGYVYWTECNTNTKSSTFVNAGKRKYINSRTYPTFEKGSKITIDTLSSYFVSDDTIEPKP